MKKLLAFFVLFLSFYGSLSALTSDERFAEVQKKYPDAVRFTFDAKSAFDAKGVFVPDAVRLTLDAKSAFVYVEGAELEARKLELGAFLIHNPDTTLIIDFAKGDGFVNKTGTITLEKKHTPDHFLKNLMISNTQGDITAIEGSFLIGFKGLQTIDLSGLSGVTSIGSYFLSGCTGLRAIDLSPLSGVTSIGNGFLLGCTGLRAIDLSPLSGVTSIGEGFLSGCEGLQTIDLSPLSGVTSIGEGFLSYCTGLQTIDLSPLSGVTSIGESFLSYCTGLQTIDLSGLSGVTSIGESFLLGCEGLNEINGLDDVFMERLDEASRKGVIEPLRESDAPALQALGQTFYVKYIYVPDPRIEDVQKIWNFDMLKSITPKPLDDIPTMTKDHVLAAFDAAFEKSTGLPEATRLYYNSHLNPILRFIFGETGTRVTWAMYPEQLAEMQIVLKHMAKMFNDRMARSEAVDTYMAMMLDGFAHCQTRQAAELNRVAMMMGLMPMRTDKGNLQAIYAMVNAFKNDQFEAMIGLEAGVHAYMRIFTALNGTIGLPVAMQSFRERMNPASDEEITSILAEYFSAFFTPENLTAYMLEKVKEVDRGKDEKDKARLSMILRGEMYRLGDEAFKEIYEEFYGDELLEKIKGEITPDEIMRLLKLMGVLKDNQERPAGLFVG